MDYEEWAELPQIVRDEIREREDFEAWVESCLSLMLDHLPGGARDTGAEKSGSPPSFEGAYDANQ